MENRQRQLEIIKSLNDNRSKVSALYSLYNSSILTAEEDRTNIISLYEQMIDIKNSMNEISNRIYNVRKDERAEEYNKNKTAIKKMKTDATTVSDEFSSSCKKYRLALQDCGSLKAEYKHDISELCKEFKAIVDENTDAIVIKGYKQQIRIIKAILEKIEALISDYNIKKNKLEGDSERFGEIYSSINNLAESFASIA